MYLGFRLKTGDNLKHAPMQDVTKKNSYTVKPIRVKHLMENNYFNLKRGAI
jgi:hypothetical protein